MINLWSEYKVFESELFGYTENLKKVFFKTFMKWLLKMKIFLLKLGIRKDNGVSVNKKSIDKSSSKISQVLAFHFTTLFSGCLQRWILNPVKHLQWSFFAKIVNRFLLLTIFAKNLHRRCSAGLKIRFWLTEILETKFIEKNNTTGTDLSIIHFDQNFRRNFWIMLNNTNMSHRWWKLNIWSF